MTSHLNSHRTTDIKPEMISGVQTGNGTTHDKYNIRGITHASTSRKDDFFMQSWLVENFPFILETCSLTKYTQCWTYSALLFFFVNLWEISDFSLGQEKGRYQKKQVGTWAYECIYLVKFILLILTVENIEPLWVYGWQHSSYNLQMPTRPPARVRTLLHITGQANYHFSCLIASLIVKLSNLSLNEDGTLKL